MLFNEIIFGPVQSRRLGTSLGINLLPTKLKICSFDCIYCECGWTDLTDETKSKLPSREEISEKLEQRLDVLMQEGTRPDALTFAGNGEPTLHPAFDGIVDDVSRMRDTYFPDAKISVLSNASRIDRENIFKALQKVDNNILKLDAGTEEAFQKINRPTPGLHLGQIVQGLIRFQGDLIIQSLFLRGMLHGEAVDNTTETETEAWLEKISMIGPRSVMIYSLDRSTPVRDLQKIPAAELQAIGKRVASLGIKVEVY